MIEVTMTVALLWQLGGFLAGVGVGIVVTNLYVKKLKTRMNELCLQALEMRDKAEKIIDEVKEKLQK